MAKRTIAALFGVVALATASLAGCGGSSSSTTSNPAAVQGALRSTANRSGLQLTASFNGNASEFQTNGQSSGLTQSQKQAILDTSLGVTVDAASGSTLAKAGKGGELDLVLRHSGTTLADIRIVGSTLYAQVDIQEFSTTYGLDKGKVAQFRSDLDRLGSQIGGLGAFNDGRWVSVNITLLDELLQTAGISLPSAPQLIARIAGAFFNSLAQSAHISDVHSGQAQLTVGGKSLITAVAQAISSTPGMSTFGSEISDLGQEAGASVPASANAQVNATVSGGIVSELELSLNQFMTGHEPTGPASVKLAVARSGAVSAPSGATAINLPQLLRAFAGGSSGS